jgi:threonine synthase
MWDFRELLPIADPSNIVTLGEGGTPIIPLRRLSSKLGIELYAKMESLNPTGTFKDREASFVVSRSLEVGDDNIVFQSTGNTGISMTTYAGIAKIRSYFFCSYVSQYKLYMPEKREGNKIILVKGTNFDVKQYADKFAEYNKFPKVSPFHERCEANTPLAYEQFIQLPDIDFYVQTIAAGMGPVGYYLGHRRLVEWGIESEEKIPRIIGIQISEFDPTYQAWRQDKEELTDEQIKTDYSYPSKPFEPTLFTTNSSFYYPFVREVIRKTNGLITQVKPEFVEQNITLLLDELGDELNPDIEKSAFIACAGIVDLVRKGVIPTKSKVLLIITGKGSHLKNLVEPDAIVTPDDNPELLLEQLCEGQPLL